jgi:hypothetical protein
MELIDSKVGILPRKLSKKHDPFSDSLRSMAKQLLELKYDATQDTESYGFEADGEGYDVIYYSFYYCISSVGSLYILLLLYMYIYELLALR